MPDLVEKRAIKLYEKGGLGAVVELANLLDLPFSYCGPCNTNTPTYNRACLACGTFKAEPKEGRRDE